ncbi:hypothetical protein AAH991_30330 [Microbispora sp. ZYX-F-249]|uniref:Pyridoxal-phosphate dependent enzyme n=1 Tax=Microbispora maris TaxID=3144104 RepID=A0ABV0AX80_9ACTN
MTGGWSTGAVARVAAWTARREPGAVVVAIFPDGPDRYLGSIFDDEYCRARGLLGRPEDGPVEIAHPGAVEVSGWARCRTLADPLLAEVPA